MVRNKEVVSITVCSTEKNVLDPHHIIDIPGRCIFPIYEIKILNNDKKKIKKSRKKKRVLGNGL